MQSSDRNCDLVQQMITEQGTQVAVTGRGDQRPKATKDRQGYLPRDRRVFLYGGLTIEPPKATKGGYRTHPETIRFS